MLALCEEVSWFVCNQYWLSYDYLCNMTIYAIAFTRLVHIMLWNIML